MGKAGERDQNTQGWVSGLVQLCHLKGPTSEIRSAKLQVSTLLLPSHVISESIRKSHPPPLTLMLINRLMFVSTWSRQIIASHFVMPALCFLTLRMISCYRSSWPFSHSKLLDSRSWMCPVLHSLSFPIMFLDLDVGTWPTCSLFRWSYLQELQDFLRAGARTGQREKAAKRINLTLNGLARTLSSEDSRFPFSCC